MPVPEIKYLVRVKTHSDTGRRLAETNPGKLIMRHKGNKSKNKGKKTVAPSSAPTFLTAAELKKINPSGLLEPKVFLSADPSAKTGFDASYTPAPTFSNDENEDYDLMELTTSELKSISPEDVISKEEVTEIFIPDRDEKIITAESYSRPGNIISKNPAFDQREATDAVPGDGKYQRSSYTGKKVLAFGVDTGGTDSAEMLSLSTGKSRLRRMLPSYSGGAGIDRNGHGSHTLSTAFGNRFGVANEVIVVPVQVLKDSGVGDSSDIIRGIYSIVDLINKLRSGEIPNDDNLDLSIPIINISIGGTPTNEIKQAFQALSDVGAIFTLSAGNQRSLAGSGWPGLVKGMPGAIVVQNVDADGSIYSSSNYDTKADGAVTFSAIGVNVPAVAGVDNNGQEMVWRMTGTSMSAPRALGAVAQWIQYLKAKNPAVSRGEILQQMKELSVPSDGWYTVFDVVREGKVAYPPMILDPGAIAQRGFNKLDFDAPIGTHAFPLTITFDKFTPKMQSQKVGLKFNVANVTGKSKLGIDISSHRFIDSVEDYLDAKKSSSTVTNPDIQLIMQSIDIDQPGDYWLLFEKEYNKTTKAFEYVLKVGQGSTVGDGKILLTKALKASDPLYTNVDFDKLKSLGFSTLSGTTPLRISKIEPYGQFMFLDKVAEQTRTQAPVGPEFIPDSTRSPTIAIPAPTKKPAPTPKPSTPPPTLGANVNLAKSGCLNFGFGNNDNIGLIIGSGSKRHEVLILKNPQGTKATLNINNKNVGAPFDITDTTEFQLKRSGSTLNIQVKKTYATTAKRLTNLKSLSAAKLPISFVGDARDVTQTVLQTCAAAAKAAAAKKAAAKKSGRLLGDFNQAYAQHLSAGAAAASQFASGLLAQASETTKTKEQDETGMSPYVILGGVTLLAAAAVAAYYYLYPPTSEKTISKPEPINYYITEDSEALEEDLEAATKTKPTSPKS